MYAIVLIVCLVSNQGQCTPYVEEPPRYYEKEEECQEEMVKHASNMAKELHEQKQQGRLQGICLFVPEVKPA